MGTPFLRWCRTSKLHEPGWATRGWTDLLSESYGTRLAQIYAAMHPDRLLRSAMIGVTRALPVAP